MCLKYLLEKLSWVRGRAGYLIVAISVCLSSIYIPVQRWIFVSMCVCLPISRVLECRSGPGKAAERHTAGFLPRESPLPGRGWGGGRGILNYVLRPGALGLGESSRRHRTPEARCAPTRAHFLCVTWVGPAAVAVTSRLTNSCFFSNLRREWGDAEPSSGSSLRSSRRARVPAPGQGNCRLGLLGDNLFGQGRGTRKGDRQTRVRCVGFLCLHTFRVQSPADTSQADAGRVGFLGSHLRL